MISLKHEHKPLAYTSNTFALLRNDVALFFRLTIIYPFTAGLLSIVLPIRPFPSGDLDELHPSCRNIYAIAIHTFLCFAQIGFVASLFFFLGTPAAAYLAWVVAFIWGNKLFCHVFLNGLWERGFVAGEKFAKNPKEKGEKWVSKDAKHEGEKWVFVNGVAVGSHWMQSNLERLARTFRRPILGIHNPSYGIPFDVLECVIQRTFSYPTSDIRNIYATLSTLLEDKKITKLVVIAHSQGSIEVGLVMDWLFATVPVEMMRKMEVYTFGNAGSHWNNPKDMAGERVVKCEHYVNEGDWVGRFGILHFREPGGGLSLLAGKQSASESEEKVQRERFVGRMFLRPGRPGHQLNQHYLDCMFPMDKKLERVVDEEEADSNGNSAEGHSRSNTQKTLEEAAEKVAEKLTPGSQDFMLQDIDEQLLRRDDTVVPIAATKDQPGSSAAAPAVTQPNGQSQSQSQQSKQKQPQSWNRKVKDLSRLWQYRNGGTPNDEPADLKRKNTV